MKNLYDFEERIRSEGYTLIAGTDEVGRGPLAGPVVAAAVILPKEEILGIDDSKKLSEKKRYELSKIIKEKAIAYSIAYIYEDEIDEINIYEASRKAMLKAINSLKIKPEYILSDAMPLNFEIPCLPIIKGDSLSASIGAASILAKVDRDIYMDEMDILYPGYNFKKNKGYPTKEHIQAIEKLGITKIHRKTYGPCKRNNIEQLRLEI